jgi:5-methylcytosine-specific restriction protein A
MRHCAQPGCPEIVQRGRCARHAVTKEHERPNYDTRRLYRSARWFALRARVLAAQPFCSEPVATGGVTGVCGRPTTDVDHVRPHAGDDALFWNPANLKAKCHACHSAKTARERGT